jgi:hypothetical protein
VIPLVVTSASRTSANRLMLVSRSCGVVMGPDCQVTLIAAPAASASFTVRTNDVHLSFWTVVWFGSDGPVAYEHPVRLQLEVSHVSLLGRR